MQRPTFATPRSIEDKCMPLSSLTPNTQNWFTKALVKEKSPIRLSQWGKQQRIVFVDRENVSMQCTIYTQDVDQLDRVLQLYKTYFIGNGKIKEMPSTSFAFTTSKYQMILNRSSYIKPSSTEQELSVEHIYEIATFAQASHFADQRNKQINLLCAVVHVFPPRFIQKNSKTIQEFVIVNEECKPLILTLWEDFLQNEGIYLTENVHEMPIILGMRLSVNTFHGISVGTLTNSTILLDPPISKAAQLQTWLISNKNYVDAVVNERLYEKGNQNIEHPLKSEIRKISQIISLPEMVKSFWIKARITISKSNQQLYFLSCPTCSKSCGACYKTDFTCLYCGNDFSNGPKPLLRFQLELNDTTGTLHAFIGGKEAETLLNMTATEVAEADAQESGISSAQLNEKFKNLHLLFYIKTSTNEFRGQKYVRNTIITFLPASEPSSTLRSSEQTGTSSQTEATPTEISSESLTDEFTTTTPPTTKRSLDSTGPSQQPFEEHSKYTKRN